MGDVYVQAMANVLGLGYGERAVFPIEYPELADCIRMGLVALVGDDGTVPDPLPPPVRSGCGGCGGR